MTNKTDQIFDQKVDRILDAVREGEEAERSRLILERSRIEQEKIDAEASKSRWRNLSPEIAKSISDINTKLATVKISLRFYEMNDDNFAAHHIIEITTRSRELSASMRLKMTAQGEVLLSSIGTYPDSIDVRWPIRNFSVNALQNSILDFIYSLVRTPERPDD